MTIQTAELFVLLLIVLLNTEIQTTKEIKTMTITKEVNAYNLETWSGATTTVDLLTTKEVEFILDTLDELYPDGMTETELNDFLWFETDTIAEWLGYADFEELYTERR